MARPLRIEFPGALYHVTARGNERRAIVRDDEDREMFVQILARVAVTFGLELCAWVLLDTRGSSASLGGVPKGRTTCYV